MALSPPSECGVRPGGGGRRSQRSGSTVLAQVGMSAEALVLQMESISTNNVLHNNIMNNPDDHAASSDEWEKEEEEEEGREEDGKL